MTRSEALNFQPIGSDTSERLHALLDRCPTSIATDANSGMGERKFYSLREFLLYPASPTTVNDKHEFTEKELNASCYSASHMLRMPPRWIADWWYFLKDVDDRYPVSSSTHQHGAANDTQNDRKWREVITILAKHCRSTIDEDATLSAEERWRFRGGLRQRPADGEWELSFPVSSVPVIRPGRSLKVRENPQYPFLRRRIRVHPGGGWSLQPGALAWVPPTIVEPKDLDEDVRKRLEHAFSPNTTGALVLLHDLLGLGPVSDIKRDNIWISRPMELWAFSDWAVRPEQPVWIPWPAPGVPSFWEFDVFLCHWNAALRDIHPAKAPENGEDPALGNVDPAKAPEKEEGLADLCIYAWVDAGAAALARKKPLWTSKSRDTPDWNALVQRLANDVARIAYRPDPRGSGAAEWLGRLAHFLWPAVSGIQTETADLFFKDRGLCEFWHKKKLGAITQSVEAILDHLKEKTEKQKLEKALEDEHAKKLREDWEGYQTSIISTAGPA